MVSWGRSAAYRIGFAWSAAFATGVALLGIVVFVAMHIAFTRQIDAAITDEASTLAAEVRGDGIDELTSAISEREASRSPARLYYAVFDGEGRRVMGHLITSRPQLGVHDISFTDPTEGPDVARGYAIDLTPSRRLLVAADREWIEQIDHTVIVTFAVAFIVICMMGLGGGMMLGGYLRRRLRAISQGAEGIIAGDRSRRMPVGPSRDEFDQVAIALNRMLDRIEMLLENLRQVSNDVAHDLRTPLSRLRNFLETHRQRPGDAITEEVICRVDELLALFSSILRIAEVESGETKRFFELIDLSALLTELLETYQPSVIEAGRDLIWSVEPNVKIDGDPQLLAQAVANLLDNAQRHTTQGALIRVTLVHRSNGASLVVADNGPGIPSNERHRVTRRFQRLDKSRSTPGFGLGLNLVTAVVALHGGELILGDSKPGLEARIELPLPSATKGLK